MNLSNLQNSSTSEKPTIRYIALYQPLTCLCKVLHINICTQYTPAKVGIISCRCAGGHVSLVHGCSYTAVILFDQTHVASMYR